MRSNKIVKNISSFTGIGFDFQTEFILKFKKGVCGIFLLPPYTSDKIVLVTLPRHRYNYNFGPMYYQGNKDTVRGRARSNIVEQLSSLHGGPNITGVSS